jgi:hypothetical protein
VTFSRRIAWNGDNMTLGDHGRPNDDLVQTESRRGALATMLAGTALGMSSLGAVLSQDAEAKGKKKKDKRKDRNGGKGKGKGNGGKGGAGNGSLPSIRFVQSSTTFDSGDIGTASSTCPEGYLPISAGYFSSIPNPVLLTSMPRLDKNDWLLEIDGVSKDEELTVIAVCLAATDDTQDEDTEAESRGRGKRNRNRKN